MNDMLGCARFWLQKEKFQARSPGTGRRTKSRLG